MESHADGTPPGGDNISGTSADGRIRNHAAFIWSVADLLRGAYKRIEYGRVILPLTVLRRLDRMLAPTKNQVLKRSETLPSRYDAILNKKTVSYGRFGNGTRTIFDPGERERYTVQVWGS